ncbi:efflux transporter periplasmic adaptor subunit [Pseudoalteromonas luteoviolacea]|uniref:Efflux transporter periplasmic adaptor subunit n=1 Tax=Pseudoalteromonas luteoviolacea TaxID=43657 RepID=A0A1C0TK65_9GAMM|nr:efflux transporter periplasmic adaptor subunit [Pseudoalteromonas luteoviolacea]
MSSIKNNLIGVLLGALIGGGLVSFYGLQSGETPSMNNAVEEKKPLYWVAPMDANYRRDKPGKSPMGMDLVPVYEESQADIDIGPGVVTISPHVENNLGVRTALAKATRLQTEITTVGYVGYDEDKLVHIHPRVAGWIDKLYIKSMGQKVEQGQALYELYSPELVNAQKEVLVALKQSDQQLISAARKRLKALKMSPKFIEHLVQTKDVSQTVTFYAPQSGVVENLNIREGFYVQPDTTMMSIGQLQQVWVEAEVFEREAALVKAGLPVTMKLDYLPGKTWQGEVDYVYPSLDAQNRTLRVRLRFSNQDLALKPNMFAQVTIHSDPVDDVITVPKEAVIRTGQQDRVVVVVGNGQFKSIDITIGRVTNEYIEVLSGLNAGDEIVTSAQFLIDSESSKNSDFKRMSVDEKPTFVWMQGQLNGVQVSQRVANITHGPVTAWGWPEMTMDFDIGDKVDIATLKVGQELHFKVEQLESGAYLVSEIHIVSEPSFPTATVLGEINQINIESRVLNISREAIEQWHRQAATMDFVAAQGIDLKQFQIGDAVKFTFEVRDDLIVTEMTLHQVVDDAHHSHSHQ